ncbi:MAG: alpha/beta hydrolase family protein [Mobilitalea sp.]
MSFIFLFSLAGCTRSDLGDIQLKEAPSTNITPTSDSVETAAVDNNDINRLDDIDKLDQVISINEVKLMKFYYDEYSVNVKYYLGVTEAPDNKFNYKIMYESNDCEVAGYISAPADYLEKNYPILIFNRGGYHYSGKVTPGFLSFLADLGFIAIATQHGGIDGGTGKDEFGGTDVQDVMSLIDIAEQLPFGNGKIYMFGTSRGGLETYCALKEENLAGKDRISAAAVLNGVSDLRAYYNVCPPQWKDILKLCIGGTPEQVPEEYEKRSAVCWPEEINIPLLICHGKTDENVSVEQAETMYDILKEHDKDVELKLYDGGHIVTAEINQYLIDWLLSH